LKKYRVIELNNLDIADIKDWDKVKALLSFYLMSSERYECKINNDGIRTKPKTDLSLMRAKI